jgi:hypothetical protein
MDRWLKAALDYVPRWLEFQMTAARATTSPAAVNSGTIICNQPTSMSGAFFFRRVEQPDSLAISYPQPEKACGSIS